MVQYKLGHTIQRADGLSRLRIKSDQSFEEDFVINNVSVEDNIDAAIPEQQLQLICTLIPADTTLTQVVRRVKHNKRTKCSQG